MSATTARDNSGALHPMSTETTPSPSNTQRPTAKPRVRGLYQTMETEQLNEAIESSVFEGGESGRPLMSVHTPSGRKTAIVLGDTSALTKGPTSFMPEARGLSEFTNVWSEPTTEKLPSASSTTPIEYQPTLSERIMYIFGMYFSFYTHVVVRLMSKPALYQSQRVWVAYVPDDATASFNSAGFEWNPSEQNEIYVVLPWKDFQHMRPTDFSLSSAVGKLALIPVTPLVTAEGLSTQLEVTFMTCPQGLRLFNPRPVSTTKYIVAQEQVDTYSENFVSKVKEQSDLVTDSTEDYTFKRDTSGQWFCRLVWTLGMLRIMGTGIAPTKKEAKQLAAKHAWWDYLDIDPIARVWNKAQPLAASIEKYMTTPITEYCCPLQCFALPKCHFDGKCAKCGSYNICYCPCLTYTRKTIEATEQIFEYEYEEPNAQAFADVGSTGDHSERQDHHWQRLETKVVQAGSNELKFSVNFKTLGVTTATLEAMRHAFVSGFPNLKITSTTNPTSTATWRITATNATTAGTMQLPGHEWDMKTGEHVFRPYWTNNTSVVDSDDLNVDVTLKRLVTSHGSDYAITLWMNTADMTYHHMKDREIETYIVAEEQATLYEEEPSEPSSSDINQVTPSAPETNQAESVGPVESEVDWKLATTFKVDPNETGIVDIPVEPSLFGKYNWFNARRYYKWKGTPRVKVMTTSASTTNAQLAVVHADTNSVDGDDPTLPPLMFPCAKASVNEASVEMDLMWRKSTPTLPVRANSSQTLGILKLCFIQGTQQLVAGANNDIQVSIFTDVSNVEYSHPTNKVAEAWTPPTIAKRKRTVAPSTKLMPEIEVVEMTASAEGEVFIDMLYGQILGLDGEHTNDINFFDATGIKGYLTHTEKGVELFENFDSGTGSVRRINGFKPESKINIHKLVNYVEGPDSIAIKFPNLSVIPTEAHSLGTRYYLAAKGATLLS
ncbi:hypothetical protein 2 [Beihai shrimp virus 2]|uniref:hypothetical protein 2 n=1 Tax=Beihai shrimp virus 2 TaxID=1922668 RepID=UPI00090AC133|nr:hypothetical protein 2 [Beihai shrimp virus 2]APG76896.1 hypothetical protein 2 [Beihai shrimp virus 2]